MDMQSRRTLLSGAGILLAVIVVAYFTTRSGGDMGPGTYSFSIKLPEISAASKSKMPNGMPPYVVLGTMPEVTGGGVLVDPAYPEDYKPLWVRTKTKDEPERLAAAYRMFLKNSEWNITADDERNGVFTLKANRFAQSIEVVVTGIQSESSARVIFIQR